MRAEATVTCAAPSDAVWAVLSDVRAWPSWTASMVRVELADRFAVGERVLVVQPATRPVTWTVEEIVPGVSFRWHSRGPGFRMTAGYALTPAGAGTEVTMSQAVTGPMAWAVGLIAARTIRRYLAEQAHALVARCAAPT